MDPFTAPRLPVDELPNYVARIRCPTDLRHQMLPLETIAVIMAGGSALRGGATALAGTSFTPHCAHLAGTEPVSYRCIGQA